MAFPLTTSALRASSCEAIPPLENGDTLTRAEFERRYEAMPHLKKAELIEGVVYVPSLYATAIMADKHIHLATWLGYYEAGTPGVEAGDNGTVRLDLDNEPQPDALLFIDPACGGHALIDADGYIEGAPELVAEVASSSASYDSACQAPCLSPQWGSANTSSGAYWIRRSIGSYCAPDSMSVYLWIPKDSTRSEVFPGLWLDPAALLRGDLATVLAVVQRGLASPEHATFATRLHPPSPTV